ncbi:MULTISPECIES: DUF1127 domain-containing protein [Dickeya]|nr:MULTISPECIES: DUF1127 domain-containing protein [Dickeya]AYH46436.1 hypothetical protein B6N31_01230 [Dickeya fangzhongdai]UGA51306.1 DUF1127 domain-containing protein [Dickeya fangzhongdai]ULR31367.1 DUF1127 domain-containing protein [Dickeya fangzhongdai]WES90462.1 DUF1127 domain-containing protein [Dickeya fangzhongdai]WOX98319.1 DUF1127 domain-containing protein [Dickeya fangzhongdai]
MTILFPPHRLESSPHMPIQLRLLRRLWIWYQHHQTRKILNELNDERLKDIGLKREDIQRLYRNWPDRI